MDFMASYDSQKRQCSDNVGKKIFYHKSDNFLLRWLLIAKKNQNWEKNVLVASPSSDHARSGLGLTFDLSMLCLCLCCTSLSCNTINWVSDWWAQSIYSTRYIGDPTTWEVLWSGEFKYPDVSLPLNKILDLSIALNQRPLAKVVTQRREMSYRVSRIDKHLWIGTNLTKSHDKKPPQRESLMEYPGLTSTPGL